MSRFHVSVIRKSDGLTFVRSYRDYTHLCEWYVDDMPNRAAKWASQQHPLPPKKAENDFIVTIMDNKTDTKTIAVVSTVNDVKTRSATK